MLPVLNVGPLAIQLPGLILLAGIWIGLNRIEAAGRQRSMNVERLSSLVFYALLAGIFGARLGYVAQNLAAFIPRPLDVFSISAQMLDAPTGMAAMLLTGFIYVQRKRLDFWQVMDALTPGLAVILMALALMNLSSGNGFGVAARLPWSIYLFDEWRHPTQIYDFIFAFAIWRVLESNPRDAILPDGFRFLTFVVLSAAARITVDAFRSENVLSGFGGVRVTQMIALLILLGALVVMRRRRSSYKEVEQ